MRQDIRTGTRVAYLIIAMIVIAWALAAKTYAHHSFAMFDQSKQLTLKGTVQEFQWTNGPGSSSFGLFRADRVGSVTGRGSLGKADPCFTPASPYPRHSSRSG